MIFGLELASFYSRPSMFGNYFGPCLEVVWRFEQKNTLYRFIEGQTHSGMPRLNEYGPL
jgi:hypothetical protein